jgi:hypothetical protein
VSDFFEPPEPSTAPPRPARHRLPPWLSAPSGTLPGVVALELVLAQTAKVAVCVTRLGVYPSGFEIDLVTMAGAEDDDALDPKLFLRPWMRDQLAAGYAGLPAEMLRFGVEFADGTKATNTAARFSLGGRGTQPDLHNEPDGPVLHAGGGGGAGGNWRQSMWVWPLPPAGSLTFVCEWPAADIPLTRHEIDAQLILDAAARARVIFSDEHLPDPPTADDARIAKGERGA